MCDLYVSANSFIAQRGAFLAVAKKKETILEERKRFRSEIDKRCQNGGNAELLWRCVIAIKNQCAQNLMIGKGEF